MIIDKDALLKEINLLLDKAEIPISVQSKLITKMVDNTHYDMDLKMDIMEHSVKFFMFERGKMVFEKRIEDEITIKYIILEDIISRYYNLLAYEEHVLPDRHLDISHIKDAKKAAFSKIGEPYMSMHDNNMSIMNC